MDKIKYVPADLVENLDTKLEDFKTRTKLLRLNGNIEDGLEVVDRVKKLTDIFEQAHESNKLKLVLKVITLEENCGILEYAENYKENAPIYWIVIHNGKLDDELHQTLRDAMLRYVSIESEIAYCFLDVAKRMLDS